ncbi:carbohydrate ABC transporter permease [Pseudolysinimonas sp.]
MTRATVPASRVPTTPSALARRRRRRTGEAAAFLAPLLLAMGALIAFPLGFAVYLSFAELGNTFALDFVGFDNYRDLLAEPATIVRAFGNTLRYALVVVALQLVIGFTAALLLNSRLRGRRWFRTALMMPWVIPSVIAALTWRWMFDPQAGVFNDILIRLGVLDGPQSWLGNPDVAPWAVIAVSVWRGFPFVTVLMLAALQTIPVELYEAASIDGAGALRRLQSITLPGIRPIAVLTGLMEGLWAFREFALIEVLTAGGPAGATEVLATLVYRMFFQFQDFGSAAALAVLMFVFVFLASIVLLRVTREDDDQ